MLTHEELLKASRNLNSQLSGDQIKKGWITRTVFQDWLTLCFCPAVNEYCQAKNLENKALLVLDNVSGNQTNLGNLTANVKVAIMPPSTTSFI